MRSFSNDAPEFFVFKIEGSKKIYKIPVAASLNNKQLVELQEASEDYAKQLDWLRQFIGSAADELTPKTTTDILQAWAQASRDSGASPGESEALSE